MPNINENQPKYHKAEQENTINSAGIIIFIKTPEVGNKSENGINDESNHGGRICIGPHRDVDDLPKQIPNINGTRDNQEGTGFFRICCLL